MCEEQDCSNPCLNRIKSVDPSTWAPFSQQVDYGLSQTVEQQCQLQFGLPLVAVVILFNAIKLGLMLSMAVGKKESRIHTIGDAIRSYLQEPDHTTKNSCLKTVDDFRRTYFTSSVSRKPWKWMDIRFSRAAGKHRWRLSFVHIIPVGS
jgi:hypothetical protein